jgi:hypothetical protein
VSVKACDGCIYMCACVHVIHVSTLARVCAHVWVCVRARGPTPAHDDPLPGREGGVAQVGAVERRQD